MTASYSEQLALVNNAITRQLRDARRTSEAVEDGHVRFALLLLCQTIDDVRALAKLIPLATQEIREDLARQASEQIAAERQGASTSAPKGKPHV